MFDYYFTFRSITAAQRSGRLLEQAGLAVQVVRTPKNLQKQGCGYSLRVKAGQFHRARELLLRSDAKYQRIYTRSAADNWEEAKT